MLAPLSLLIHMKAIRNPALLVLFFGMLGSWYALKGKDPREQQEQAPRRPAMGFSSLQDRHVERAGKLEGPLGQGNGDSAPGKEILSDVNTHGRIKTLPASTFAPGEGQPRMTTAHEGPVMSPVADVVSRGNSAPSKGTNLQTGRGERGDPRLSQAFAVPANLVAEPLPIFVIEE